VVLQGGGVRRVGQGLVACEPTLCSVSPMACCLELKERGGERLVFTWLSALSVCVGVG